MLRSDLLPFFRNLKLFARSETGSILPLLAAALFILPSLAGIAIDVGRMQMLQSKLQTSLDAAGLAAGATISTSSVQTEVQKYLTANFNSYMGATATLLTPTINSTNTIINLSATATLPTTFMSLAGINTITVNATSQISRAITGLELVFVLDNTGSMANSAGGSVSKISALKTAATTLINSLFNGASTVNNGTLWVGIVPFSQAVNIGTSHTTWMNNSYTYDGTTTPLDWGTNGTETWGGCVDARQSGEDVTDDPPSTSNPSTLFGEYYWTSDSLNTDGISNGGTNNWKYISSYAQCVTTYNQCVTTYNKCVTTYNRCKGGHCTTSSPTCSTGGGYTCTLTTPTCTTTESCTANGTTTCTVIAPTCNSTESCTVSSNTTCTVIAPTCTNVGSCTPSSNTTCAPNYSYSSPLNTTNKGPNLDCPQQITMMTNNSSPLLTAINAMTAQGDTEINQGLIWAWNLLSPRWQGQWGGTMNQNGLPLAYNTVGMAKAVVLLTDGENTIDNSSHGAYWFLGSGRTGSTNSTTAVTDLNNKTLAICTAMKNVGINIYTIALGTDTTTTSLALLQSCANPNFYFNSPSTTTLQGIFNTIGDSLSNLRVSQ